MREIKKQINKQKTKTIKLVIVIWLLASISFTWFIYDEAMNRTVNAIPAQAIEEVLPWGIGFSAISLLWVFAVLLVTEIKDKNSEVFRKLTKEEKMELEQEMADIDLFEMKLTVGTSIAILNANGYTLKLIPIKDIDEMYIRREKPIWHKQRLPDFYVMHFHMKSGQKILSSAIPITDPIWPIVKTVFDNLATRIAGKDKEYS